MDKTDIGRKASLQGKHHLLLQTVVILAGMGCLFGLIGWMIFGAIGLAWALLVALLLFMSTPRVSPWMVLRMYRARKLTSDEAPGLFDIVAELSRRAGISTLPLLYYVPSPIMNAFSVGSAKGSAIALSDGLIRYLSPREITGVLAHEITHIRNNDLKLHALADFMTRITSTLSFLGQVLIIIYLPAAFFSKTEIPLIPILLLIFAPAVSMLLQLALSRTREFDADAGAAELTGDPMGLASALRKMDRYEQSIWDLVYLPGRKQPHPSLLRTHPHTPERLERLSAMAEKGEDPFMNIQNREKFMVQFPETEQSEKRRRFSPWK
ncbi:MAG TPA: zinc metalloprotease HtpX [Desulfomonilia bacterium]|nr:zinc metalloprotease HtpX [Desulfomonilia bacterium]